MTTHLGRNISSGSKNREKFAKSNSVDYGMGKRRLLTSSRLCTSTRAKTYLEISIN